MPHIVESAASGRAKCKGCGKPISKGELRFGERLPNPFAEGEMTLWFHLQCATYKRPEPLLAVLDAVSLPAATVDGLRAAAAESLAFRRLPRIDGVERATSARARCRSCGDLIATNLWRIPLALYAEGMFNPTGFIHARCARSYFETDHLLARLCHFAAVPLSDADVESLQSELTTTQRE